MPRLSEAEAVEVEYVEVGYDDVKFVKEGAAVKGAEPEVVG